MQCPLLGENGWGEATLQPSLNRFLIATKYPCHLPGVTLPEAFARRKFHQWKEFVRATSLGPLLRDKEGLGFDTSPPGGIPIVSVIGNANLYLTIVD